MLVIKNWLQAARLRTLPLAISSTLCGNLITKINGKLNYTVMFLAILTATSLQIFCNLANDYGDFIHGADSEIRQGPKRVVATDHTSLAQMRLALKISALLSSILCITLLAVALPHINANFTYSWLIWLTLGLTAIITAYAYTAGLKPYGYHCSGDISVFIFLVG